MISNRGSGSGLRVRFGRSPEGSQPLAPSNAGLPPVRRPCSEPRTEPIITFDEDPKVPVTRSNRAWLMEAPRWNRHDSESDGEHALPDSTRESVGTAPAVFPRIESIGGALPKVCTEYLPVGLSPERATSGLVRIDLVPRRGFPRPLRSTFAVSHGPGGLPLFRLLGVFQPVSLMGFDCLRT